MEFIVNRDIFLKSLSHACGIIEKKTTLPILSNILIDAKDSKIKITATDLDIIYSEEMPLLELKKEGATTVSANILHDILKQLQSEAKIELSLQNINSLFLQYTFKQPQIYPAWPWPLPCPLIAFFTANERI